MTLSKELDHPKKDLIQNTDDNKWLNCAWSDSGILQIITLWEKLIETLQDNLISKDMQYSIEIRDIHKIEKKNSYSFFVHIAQLLFVVMKTRKDIQCVSKKKKKKCFQKTSWFIIDRARKQKALCSRYKLVHVDDKFSKSFNSHLREDAVLSIVYSKKVNTAVIWWKTC